MTLLRDSLIQSVRVVEREEAGGEEENECTRNKEASKVKEEKETQKGRREDETGKRWDSSGTSQRRCLHTHRATQTSDSFKYYRERIQPVPSWQAACPLPIHCSHRSQVQPQGELHVLHLPFPTSHLLFLGTGPWLAAVS